VLSAKGVEAHILLSEQDDAISRGLVDARLNAEPLSDFPGRLPENLEQAYAIQHASIERWPDEVAGWKVAKLSAADRARFSADRLAGPVFRSSVHKIEPGSGKVMPVYEGGFAAVEAEIVLELGVTVQPIDRDYSDEELAELVSAVYGGSEIASSPMALVVKLGATSLISDFGNNAGLVIGPKIPDWTSLPPESLSAKVTVDDVVVGNVPAVAITDGPLQALRFLVNLFASQGSELPEGTLISTGAVTGVHDVQVSSSARIDYGSFGWFDVRFEPMARRQ
jgi:2-keto-4-pentenoate hydratase